MGDASAYLSFAFGFGSEPCVKLLVQHGDLLNGGFLGSHAGHLKFQLSDILTRPRGDHGFSELEVVLPGEYISEDIRSIEWGPL